MYYSFYAGADKAKTYALPVMYTLRKRFATKDPEAIVMQSPKLMLPLLPVTVPAVITLPDRVLPLNVAQVTLPVIAALWPRNRLPEICVLPVTVVVVMLESVAEAIFIELPVIDPLTFKFPVRDISLPVILSALMSLYDSRECDLLGIWYILIVLIHHAFYLSPIRVGDIL